MMIMRLLKGQYFSFDAIVASVIFVLALVSLLSYWNSLRNSLDFQNSAVSKESVRVSNALTEQGTPENVACNLMNRLGFANSNGKINWSIVECAETASFDQDQLKNKLETGYNVTIVFERADGSQVIIGPELDQNLIDDLSNIYKIRRIVSLDSPEDEIAYLDLYLYR